MALIRLKGGRVYDPAHGVDGEVRDLWLRDGRIVAAPAGERPDREYDVSGRVVMAGAIDMHTHIGGGKVNIARAMLPEDHRGDILPRGGLTRSSCGRAAPGTLATDYRYAEMGYTACFEPAVLPVNARQAHMEMGDTPIVDKGGYVMLGSDDFLLAGRSVPAWMAGLAFIAANLGAQEVIGMAASGAKYGWLTSHFYWIGAIPAMAFVAVFMVPVY